MEVTLLWNVLENRVAVTVSDLRSGETFVIETERSHALEVFYHPMRTRGFLDRGTGGVGDDPTPMTASG